MVDFARALLWVRGGTNNSVSRENSTRVGSLYIAGPKSLSYWPTMEDIMAEDWVYEDRRSKDD